MNVPWFANRVSTERPPIISWYFFLCQETRTKSEHSQDLRKIPFNNTKGWHSIISLYSITAYILRCSKLPLTLLWVWTVSRSRLSPYCVLHILKKYFHNTEWFILHLLFFINQKGLSDRENFFTLYLRFWKIQTRFLCYENSARNRKH